MAATGGDMPGDLIGGALHRTDLGVQERLHLQRQWPQNLNRATGGDRSARRRGRVGAVGCVANERIGRGASDGDRLKGGERAAVGSEGGDIHRVGDRGCKKQHQDNSPALAIQRGKAGALGGTGRQRSLHGF